MFEVGNLVCHKRAVRYDEDIRPGDEGRITGYGPWPDAGWLRVKTGDGQHRIWSRDNVIDISDLEQAENKPAQARIGNTMTDK